MYHLASVHILSGMVRRVVAAVVALVVAVVLAACGADPAPTATPVSTVAPAADPALACAAYRASEDAVNTPLDAWIAEGKPTTSAHRDAFRAAWAAQPDAMRGALALGRGTDVGDELATVVRVVEGVHSTQDGGGTVSAKQSDLLGTAMWAADRACAQVG